MTLELAQRSFADDKAIFELLEQMRSELLGALAELRELARGIHPAVLTERGLGPALDALAGRAHVPVDVGELPGERPPAGVEAAAYYLVAEALENVAKYAQASAASVRVCVKDMLDSRRMLFDPAAANGALILAFHFHPFPSLGEVRKVETGWTWHPIDTGRRPARDRYRKRT
jgi:signal transduction histidine kinase